MNKALALGVIDTKASSLRQAVEGADLVLVAVPVNVIENCLRDMLDHLSPSALVMDVGSTKAMVAEHSTGAVLPLERFSFYEHTRSVSLVVQSGDLRKYANIVLRKGVIASD